MWLVAFASETSHSSITSSSKMHAVVELKTYLDTILLKKTLAETEIIA